MRRSLNAMALVAAIALTVSACGSDSDRKKAADPKTVSGTVKFWDTSDPTNESPTFKKLVADFEKKYPKVTVDYQSVPFAEAQNKFKTAAGAKKGAPDVLRAEVAWVSEFASLGYLYALDGSTLLEDADDYLPTPRSSTQFEGKSYGVPQVTDSLGLMFNKKLLADAGVSKPPTTWAEVVSTAKTIKEKTGKAGFYMNPAGYWLLPFFYGNGGDLVDTKAKKITLNSEANLAGLESAKELISSGAAVKPPAQDAYGNMMTSFNEGNVAMIIQGPWEVANVLKAPDFGGVKNLGVAPVPAGDKKAGAPVGGHDYVLWSGIKKENTDASVAFVEFMNSAESQSVVAADLGLLPTRTSAYALPDVKDNPAVTAFKPVVDSAIARPWIPEGGQFFAALDKLAVEVLVKGNDPRKALDKAAKTYKSEVVKDYSLD